MSEWITDRRPTAEDADNDYVWVTTGAGIVLRQEWDQVRDRPWMPIARPEPYVNPKRFRVEETRPGSNRYAVYDNEDDLCCSFYLPTREAAERIAAIYEEVMS